MCVFGLGKATTVVTAFSLSVCVCVRVYSRARGEDTATLRSRGVSLVHIPTQTTPLPTAQSLQLRVALYDNWALFRSLFFKIKISIFPATFPRCVFFFSLQLELAAQEKSQTEFPSRKAFFFPFDLHVHFNIEKIEGERRKKKKEKKSYLTYSMSRRGRNV